MKQYTKERTMKNTKKSWAEREIEGEKERDRKTTTDRQMDGRMARYRERHTDRQKERKKSKIVKEKDKDTN